MKHLPLQTPKYQYYEQHFGRWLGAMGMATSSQYGMCAMLKEFLHFIEQRGIYTCEAIRIEDIQHYFGYLQTRKNIRRGGTISANYYNKHLQTLRKFSKYLWHYEHQQLPIEIPNLVPPPRKIVVLTIAEVKSLYQSCVYHPELTLRDQVMLDLLYGCGLRRNEARRLEIQDIYLEQRHLHVRFGKRYTQRYVPFTNEVAQRIYDYIHMARPSLLRDKTLQQVLISTHSKVLNGASMIHRLRNLQNRSELESLQHKHISLHTLRHSIATHLLAQGVPLQQIAHFLGHKSLESTQIYTHLNPQ